MGVIRKALAYIGQYGIRSLASLVWEKTVVDRHRFAEGARVAPTLPEWTEPEGDGARHTSASADGTVLYLVHTFYPDSRGGTERFVFNMASTAVKRGRRAIVLTLDQGRPISDYTDRIGGILIRKYEYCGIACIGIRYKRAPRGFLYKRVSADSPDMRALAAHLISEQGITHIHAAYPQPFAPFLAEARALGIGYTLTLTDFALWCHYATAVRRDGTLCSGSRCGTECAKHCRCACAPDTEQRYLSARELLLGASLIAVPSRYCARVARAELPEAAVRVIPHGISDTLVRTERQGAPRSFLYAGKLAPHKGVELLIKAFSRLDTDGVTLTVIGGGSPAYERHLRSIADSRVRFLGSLPPDGMRAAYESADCIVVPSLFPETYCFSLREALATGAVAVAADIGALPEAIRDGENGVLFTAGDADSLTRALRRATELDPLAIGECAHPTVDEEYTAYSTYGQQ